MNDKIENIKNDEIENIKKVYSKPTVEEIGDVSELTKGTTDGNQDDGAGKFDDGLSLIGGM